MVGILEIKEEKGRGPRAGGCALLDLPCLRVEIPAPPGLPSARLARRVDKGARLLARAGVRRVLTAAEFPHWPRLRRYGLEPVEPEGFCQALAVPLALAALKRQGVEPARAWVTLSGPSPSRALLRAAEELCPLVRRLSLAVPGEEETLAAWLWREFGAAMASPGAGGRADVVLRFGAGGPEGRAVLALYGPRPELGGFVLLPPEGLEEGGLDRLAVLALLWQEGRLAAEEIRIAST